MWWPSVDDRHKVRGDHIDADAHGHDHLTRCGDQGDAEAPRSEGEIYDEIIRRLIEAAGWDNLDERWDEILETDEFIALDEL